MIASTDDARLLFGRWKQDSLLLRIRLLSSSSLIFDGLGTVRDFTHEALKLGGESWHFVIPLTDASIVFSDPREIPISSVRETEAGKYELGLSLRLPQGDQLVLMELKASEEETPPELDD
jgi:hypothetical protein